MKLLVDKQMRLNTHGFRERKMRQAIKTREQRWTLDFERELNIGEVAFCIH